MKSTGCDVFMFIYIPLLVIVGTQSALGGKKLFVLIYKVLDICVQISADVHSITHYKFQIIFYVPKDSDTTLCSVSHRIPLSTELYA